MKSQLSVHDNLGTSRSPLAHKHKSKRDIKQESYLKSFKSHITKTDEVIVEHLKKFKQSQRRRQETTLDELHSQGLYTECWEVKHMSSQDVVEKIDEIYRKIESQTHSGVLYFDVPKAKNEIYVPELQCLVMEGKKVKRVSKNFKDVRLTKTTKAYSRLDKLLCQIHTLCKKDKIVSLRWIYYTYRYLFDTADDVSTVLDKICLMIGCTRSSLNIHAQAKGSVIGHFYLRHEGEIISCHKKSVKIISQHVKNIEFASRKEDFEEKEEEGFTRKEENEALFILLVEKNTVFERLVDEGFHDRFPCIIITGSGQPDVATKAFLKKMKKHLKLPVFALMDYNPYGFEIFSVYLNGSKNMIYACTHLNTPDIKWFCLRDEDVTKYGTLEDSTTRMAPDSLKKIDKLLKRNSVESNTDYVNELTKMKQRGKEMQIEGLNTLGFNFLTEIFLPAKLQELAIKGSV